MVSLSSPDNDRKSPVPQPTFVGRDREVGRFRAVVDRVLAGHGQVVLVTGEAGIGKTTLVKLLTGESVFEAGIALAGHCYDLTTTPPYGPWLEVLQAAKRLDGHPLPDVLSGDEALSSAVNQGVLFDTFLRFFRDVASEHPLAVILEDMHWADQASLDLLRFIARQIETGRMLVVVSYRDDEITRRHPLFQLLPILVREAPVERLQIRRLDADEVRAFIATRYQLSVRDLDQVTSYVSDRSDGNPFFMNELLAALEDERVLRAGSDGATIGELGTLRTPPLLQQVIERRLSRLETVTREALEVAAVVGQDVSLDVWQAMTQLPEDQLDVVVQEALEHRIFEESPSAAGFRFTHALIRETLNQGIALIRRRRLHQRTADVLTTLLAPDPDRVAYHFQQAGDARAADWLTQAGERAQRAFAWFTAADRFEAAVKLLEPIPDRDRERGWLLYRISQLRRHLYQNQNIAYLDEALEIAAVCRDEELHAAALFGRGLLKCFGGNLKTGLAELEAGSIATERLGFAAASDVRPGGALDRTVYGLWLALAGRFDEAVVVTQQALSTARIPPVPGSYRPLAIAYSFLGQVDRAQQAFDREHVMIRAANTDPANAYLTLTQHLSWHVMPYQADDIALRERLLAECDELSERGKGTFSVLASQSISNMPMLLLQGDWDQARNVVADPDVWFVGPRGREWHRMWAALIAHHLGEAGGSWHRMQVLLPDGPPLNPDNTTSPIVPPMLQLVSQTGFEPGDLAIARVWLEAFDHWLEWSGAVLGRAENAVLWSHYHEAAGDHGAARSQAERALAFASEPRQPLALIAAHRTLGQLDTADRRFEEADHHLREALTLVDACAVPFERALVLLARSTLQIATGDQGSARTSLGEVVAICQRLGANPTLARAEALMASLKSSEQVVSRQGGLSARETDVLRLIVDGKTDREIAASLFISPRTVTTHVTHILNKLGVSTRTEAAACAVREGLI